MNEKKFKEENQKYSMQDKVVIESETSGKKSDFIDYIFGLIIPRDHDIKYPDDSLWKRTVDKILAIFKTKKK